MESVRVTNKKVRGDKIIWMCGAHRTKESMRMWEPAGIQPTGPDQNEKVVPCSFDSSYYSKISKDEFPQTYAFIKKINDFVLVELRKCAHAQQDSLSLLIERSDVMFSHQEKGTHFERHIDNTTGDGRRLTVSFYFNQEWDESDGGYLRIYTKDKRIVDVPPRMGQLCFIYSDECPHEVRESAKDR